MREGTLVDATIINAPSSTKNRDKARDPGMHQTKKGSQWYFGMKAHNGVNRHSGLVHTVVSTAANVSDISQTAALLHGSETQVYADAGYVGLEKRDEIKAADPEGKLDWQIAARRQPIRKMRDGPEKDRLLNGPKPTDWEPFRHLTLRTKMESALSWNSLLGIDPNTMGAQNFDASALTLGLPTITMVDAGGGASILRIEFPRNLTALAEGYRYIAQFSCDLSEWIDVETGISMPLDMDGIWNTLVIDDPGESSSTISSRNARLKLVAP